MSGSPRTCNDCGGPVQYRSRRCRPCYLRRSVGRWLANAVANRPRDACWLDFPGDARASGGRYPQMWHDGRMRKVAHVVLTLDGHERPSPPANHGLHSCDDTDCFNPGHLRWGTHVDNMQDRLLHGDGYRNARNQWS